ncbi:MAG TPA: outer membrane beta-barrel protein [Xanthobacteraceae bacterium]|nr:outer membrane beta-barrel protein [Xanthobacteraceae bacterium]
MKTRLAGRIAIIFLAGSSAAYAADIAPGPAAFPAAPYNWSGFYVGATAGAAWGQYDTKTSTVSDTYMDAVEAAAVNTAAAQSLKANGFAAGLEGGYNWQSGHLLLGLEADLQALHLNGASNTGAVAYPDAPVFAFTATASGGSDWLFTLRPRIGYVTANNWLLYVTGGLALTKLQANFSFVDSLFAEESGSVDTLRIGTAAGGGFEVPLSDRLSVKFDYLHVGFGDTAGTSTANNLTTIFPDQVFFHSSDLKADIFRAGLNYRFGGSDLASSEPILPLKFLPAKAAYASDHEWQVEVGTRLWLSTGWLGAPDPLIDVPPPTLGSRIDASGLQALSGETFARVDHASGFFAKGYLGAGGIVRGQLNDEDFPAVTAYSNTQSAASGNIGYATIDLGYNFIRTADAKLGAFVGYNYYDQALNAYGCTQLAGDTAACVPALPANLLVLTETDSLNSLRVGLSTQLMLTDRFKLTADAAYVPWVSFAGFDDHLLRQLLIPEAANGGDGVMLEAMLDYRITNAWSVGVGGRYWAWNLNTGNVAFDFLTPPANLLEAGRFNVERYGMFVQSSYQWGEPDSPVGGSPIPTKAPVLAAAPINWTGFYAGGLLGGGVSRAAWSDPFGSTPSGLGGTDLAGFGDTTHATGPLGGGQIGADWQTGRWVAGIQADASAADLRGENTCFSGLGGVNCQHVVDVLATLTGRLGFAWDRSLAYVKGGGAWVDTTYTVMGDTGLLTLGSASTAADSFGWTVGGGLEYALTNHWTTFMEYDHIGFAGTTVPFPTVAVVNAQNINVRQAIDLFKVGVNYRFDFAALAAAVRN